MWPRPPAPMTTHRSRGVRRRAALAAAWYAVRPASASAATADGSSESSSLTTLRAEVRRYSAYPPWVSMPGNALVSQCTSSPDRQARHSPHVISGCTITLSPSRTLVTAEPTASTQPAFSWPIVYGQDDLGLLGPLALEDVQVGAADAGAADAHHDVEGPLGAGDRDLGHLQLLVVADHLDGSHRGAHRFCSSGVVRWMLRLDRGTKVGSAASSPSVRRVWSSSEPG